MLQSAREGLIVWRGVCAAVAVLVSLIASAGMMYLSFTTDYRAFFSEDNPDLKQLEFIEQNFARAETLVITLAPQDGAVFSGDTLDAVRWLSDQALRLPYAKGVSSITEYYPARGREGELVVQPLIPEGPLTDSARAAIRAEALADERITGIMLARDGDVTGIIAHFELPHETPEKEIPTLNHHFQVQNVCGRKANGVFMCPSLIVSVVVGEVDSTVVVEVVLGMPVA